ncbi:MAG: DUF4982 domain-containing protein [Clostridia bacterium]|nr:DUF4982 domain-containing protein [Clostridia bacterium]
MERLFNDGWSFLKLPLDSSYADAEAAVEAWKPVDLPHDFLIQNHEDLYENTDGWYRRTLEVPAEWLHKAVWLRFDGVYQDCDVLLNGDVVATHHYGYTCFDVPLRFLQEGKNTLHVHVRHQSPNSRWYSGAGIFRDVTLHVEDKRHIVPDGIYVNTRQQGSDWVLTIDAELTGPEDGTLVHHELYEADEKTLVMEDTAYPHHEWAHTEVTIHNPTLWDTEKPYCYRLKSTCGGHTIWQNIGFRSIELTADCGLLLNGEVLKLHGVCLHHDLGCLGSAFNAHAALRQLTAMKEMGVNSLRTSHNPPAKQVMELCDSLGILVVNELLDMWKRQKTPYDYARFFEEDVAQDVAAWVRRDRNHPCMLMWSVGNEIFDTHVDESAVETTQMLCTNVRLNDPSGNAFTTIGSNFMPWQGAQNCAVHVQAVGYNYGEKLYADHHQKHPEWVIYGSETASAVSSRGVYRFPMSAPILSDDDLQCSSLGNSTTSWGTKDMRMCLVEDMNTPFSLGQYLWTGIDYIGEPTPYHTRSSYFGMMDTCVFPKDFWYLCKSVWNPEPMVHIGVHWDWNPGQTVDVPVMTNGESCELFLNGKSLGVQKISRTDWRACCGVWQVPFVPGELKAVAYDAAGDVLAADARFTPGDSARIVLDADGAALLTANGEDIAFITVSMADADGLPVDNACDRVHIAVTGVGRLLGLDNGDSTDREGYKTSTRRLFNGKLLIMAGCTMQPGVMRVTVTSPGKDAAVLEIPFDEAPVRDGVSCGVKLCRESDMPQEKPVRKVTLTPMDSKMLTQQNPSMRFLVSCQPADADCQTVSFRITNAKGIESPCAAYSVDGDVVTVTGLGDDTVYLRAMVSNGYDHPRIISQQDITITGMGQPNLDPYSFVTGGLFSISYGDVGNGNEQGVSFSRDGESMAGYEKVDFGPVGSDEITLPIFALDSKHYDVTLWDGDPRDGGTVIAVLPYQKPSRWNVYQPETYRLPVRLVGVHTLCFTMKDKIHLKGFSFTRQSRAWQELSALEADSVYGDSFTRTEEGVVNIGNNVSLCYDNMAFGDATRAMLTIEGLTPLAQNPITIRMTNAEGETLTSLAQFQGTERGLQSFPVEVLPGVCSVTFVFLPGCQFDFYKFRFRQE